MNSVALGVLRLLSLISLVLYGCGVTNTPSPIEPPISMVSERDICLGHVIPIISTLTTKPTLEPCVWLDKRPHVLIDYISCKRKFTDQNGVVINIKEDRYDRWTWTEIGTVFFLKNQLKTLFFTEINEPACVQKFFGVDGVEDSDYYPEKQYCETVSILFCDTGK